MPQKSDPPVLLYLHIPKCGGSTVTSVIYQQCRLDTSDPEKKKYWHRGIYFYPAGLFSKPSFPSNPTIATMLKRPDLTAVVGHFAFGIHQYVDKSYTYVTILRNPVSRVLSLYDELRRQNKIQTSLEDFVSSGLLGVDNDQTRRIAGKNSIEEDHEVIYQRAKENLTNHFRVVGLTERMDETLCLMHRVFGWEQYFFYYPKNVTIQRSDSRSVDTRIIGLIEERNSLDLQLYAFAERRMVQTILAQGTGFQLHLQQYRQLQKEFIERTDLSASGNAENQQVHQIVLNMMNKGSNR